MDSIPTDTRSHLLITGQPYTVVPFPTPANEREAKVNQSPAEIRVVFANNPPTDDVDRPETLGLITVNVTGVTTSISYDPPPTVHETISDPGNIPQIGFAVNDLCERWADRPLQFRFHSLETLLEATSPRLVFQFLHTLNARLESVDARSQFTIDPTHVTDQHISTFGVLFDEVTIDDMLETKSFPQATDEEVAQTLGGWINDGAEYDIETIREATDEEIDQLLGN